MSRPRKLLEVPAKPPEVRPVGFMALSGLVKTTKGYAVATATLSEDGETLEWKLGPSQAFKQFVAVQHRLLVANLAQKI